MCVRMCLRMRVVCVRARVRACRALDYFSCIRTCLIFLLDGVRIFPPSFTLDMYMSEMRLILRNNVERLQEEFLKFYAFPHDDIQCAQNAQNA